MEYSKIDIAADEALKKFNENNEAVTNWDIARLLNQLGFIESPESLTASTAICKLTYDGIKMKEKGYLNTLMLEALEKENYPPIQTSAMYSSEERYNDVMVEESYKYFNGESHAYLPVQLKNIMLKEGLINDPISNRPDKDNTILVTLTVKGLEVQYEGWYNYKERKKIEQERKSETDGIIQAIRFKQKQDETVPVSEPKKERDWFFQIALIIITLILGTVVTIVLKIRGII